MPDSNEGDSKNDYVIRTAAVRDAQVIAWQRASMFRDMGHVSPEESELLGKACEPWFSDLLTDGDYVAWLVEHDGTVVAGGGMFIQEAGPAPGRYRMGRLGHIANVYTEPAHRRLGLARRLMETMLHWCASNGIDFVTLGASDEGKRLYESLGFKPISNMMLTFESMGADKEIHLCGNIETQH